MSFLDDIWDEVKDFTSSETFLVSLGIFLTAGQAGWVLGVLQNAEQIAVREAMSSLASVVNACNADPSCIARGDKNFFDAWKGQLAWRTAKTMEVGGPQLAGSVVSSSKALSEVAEYGGRAIAAWDEAKRLYPGDRDKAEEVALGKLRGACVGRSVCRDDALAIAANFHLRDNVFNTFEWDPKTGERKRYVRALGKRPLPKVTKSYLLWVNAQRTGDKQVELYRRQYEADLAAGGLIESAPRGDLNLSAPGPGFVSQALIFTVLTSPAWVPLFALPWWRARKKKKS